MKITKAMTKGTVTRSCGQNTVRGQGNKRSQKLSALHSKDCSKTSSIVRLWNISPLQPYITDIPGQCYLCTEQTREGVRHAGGRRRERWRKKPRHTQNLPDRTVRDGRRPCHCIQRAAAGTLREADVPCRSSASYEPYLGARGETQVRGVRPSTKAGEVWGLTRGQDVSCQSPRQPLAQFFQYWLLSRKTQAQCVCVSQFIMLLDRTSKPPPSRVLSMNITTFFNVYILLKDRGFLKAWVSPRSSRVCLCLCPSLSLTLPQCVLPSSPSLPTHFLPPHLLSPSLSSLLSCLFSPLALLRLTLCGSVSSLLFPR